MGKCVKRGSWILCIYKSENDEYCTVRLVRAEMPKDKSGMIRA